MEDNKIFQFIQALKFFELELEEMTGKPGYEDRIGKGDCSKEKRRYIADTVRLFEL